MNQFDKDCKCSGCSFMLRLQAELLDTSYKKKPAEEKKTPTPLPVKTERVVIYKDKPEPKQQRARDKAFYHAGRFAMGARDSNAIAGNKAIAGLINGKARN